MRTRRKKLKVISLVASASALAGLAVIGTESAFAETVPFCTPADGFNQKVVNPNAPQEQQIILRCEGGVAKVGGRFMGAQKDSENDARRQCQAAGYRDVRITGIDERENPESPFNTEFSAEGECV